MPAINPNALETFELENLNLEAILFQTGYLTIEKVTEIGLFQLNYPNKEVRDTMIEILMKSSLSVNGANSDTSK